VSHFQGSIRLEKHALWLKSLSQKNINEWKKEGK
jgi:hypothetical protein